LPSFDSYRLSSGTTIAANALQGFGGSFVMHKFRVGSKVEWQWGKGTGTGKVAESFDKDVERTIAGSQIKRKASTEEPAYLIAQDDGAHVLKSQSELKAAS
jgi:hypothetical protein